jgi:hypothetical protein
MTPITRPGSSVSEPDAHRTRLTVGPRVVGNSRYLGGMGSGLPFVGMHSALQTVFPPCARRGGPCLGLQYGHTSEEVRVAVRLLGVLDLSNSGVHHVL